MRTLLQDFRYAVRILLRSPGFTAAAALCLALGIGATTSMFGAVNGMLLRPLPYKDPGRVVALYSTQLKQGLDRAELSQGDLVQWRTRNRVFAAMAAYDLATFNLSVGETPDYVEGEVASTNLFDVLGVQPAIGRTFRAEEEMPGRDEVVILSDELWRRRFDADAGVVGRTVVMNGVPRTVIGVMPPRFQFPGVRKLWVPLAFDAGKPNYGTHTYSGIARLKPGVTLEQARSDLAGVARQVAAELPDRYTGWGATVTTQRDKLTRDYRAVLLIALGAVFLVLLIACANVANLMLARAMARQKEMAVRTALGASRWRVIRLMLAESLVVSLLGAVLGVVLAQWGIAAMVAAIPYPLPDWMIFDIDQRVMAFTVAVAVGSAVLFGLLPALQSSAVNVNETLKDGGRSATTGLKRARLRSALIVSEIALSVVLLVSAALLMKSFVRLQSVHPGFDTERVLTVSLPLAGERYASIPQRTAFFDQVIERIGSLPGVRSVAAVHYAPLAGSNTGTSLTIEGQPVARGEEHIAPYRAVTHGYFATLGVPVVRGREFTRVESADTASIAIIVNETAARRYWPREDAVGKHVKLSTDPAQPWLTIVGVAGDVKLRTLDEKPSPQLYVPYASAAFRTMTLLVRTAGDPGSMAATVRATVKSIDAGIPAFNVYTMREIVTRSMWTSRLWGGMFGTFALVALLLAAVGVYGVMAYGVTQRTHEIGVRMALGAESRDIVRLIVGRGITLTILGVGLGLVLAFGVTRLLAGLLFGVQPSDPLTFTAVAALLSLVALSASYLPARRATRVGPMVALRDDG